MVVQSLKNEKVQHELTKQQLADFISGSDQREQKLKDKLQARKLSYPLLLIGWWSQREINRVQIYI